jgi:hypothetical protein
MLLLASSHLPWFEHPNDVGLPSILNLLLYILSFWLSISCYNCFLPFFRLSFIRSSSLYDLFLLVSLSFFFFILLFLLCFFLSSFFLFPFVLSLVPFLHIDIWNINVCYVLLLLSFVYSSFVLSLYKIYSFLSLIHLPFSFLSFFLVSSVLSSLSFLHINIWKSMYVKFSRRSWSLYHIWFICRDKRMCLNGPFVLFYVREWTGSYPLSSCISLIQFL